MYTVVQIREFRNEMEPEANYMEIFYLHISPEGKVEIATNIATQVTRILSPLSSPSTLPFSACFLS